LAGTAIALATMPAAGGLRVGFEDGGGAADTAPNGIGVPKVTAGPVDGGAAAVAAGDGAAKIDVGGAVAEAGGDTAPGTVADGGANGKPAPPGCPAGALAVAGAVPPANRPPGGGVLPVLGSSTFGAVGHPSATPGG
jgi:hypothetical protein